MANRAYVVTLGLSLVAALTGCKEGHRHTELPEGQCFVTNADGLPEVVSCDGGQARPDAMVDAKVPDAMPDGMAGDAGPDAFVLPTNACEDDVAKTRPIPDAGVDGGSVSVLSIAQSEASKPANVATCVQMGIGPAFIQCIAVAVAQAVPELSEDCPTCYGALTECGFVNCASGGNDQCLFANQAEPTEEELAECNRCQCESGCVDIFDSCSGLGTTSTSCPSPDGGLPDGSVPDGSVPDANVDGGADAG